MIKKAKPEKNGKEGKKQKEQKTLRRKLVFLIALCLLVGVMLVSLKLQAAEEIKVLSIPDFSGLAEQQSKIVVSVEVNYEEEPPADPQDNPLGFFGIEERPKQGSGSGFIINSEKGYIITNYHVIKGTNKIHIRLMDKQRIVAKVIGSDEYSDIALLQIDTKAVKGTLEQATFSKGRSIKPGEWVFAVGSPFGLDYTVTSGIISAINRDIQGSNYTPFIQTDVAINPGNSGGPLFNIYGEVIGITSQIYTRSGAFQGISFAIPMSYANSIIDELIKTGKVKRGYIGIQIKPVIDDENDMFSTKDGARVEGVEKNSPADKAGLKAGDIITEFDGSKITSTVDLPRLVAKTEIGAKKSLKVQRAEEKEGKEQKEKKELSLEVVIGELPQTLVSSEDTITNILLGIEVRDLKPSEAVKGKYEAGVVVEKVGKGIASRILATGMIITKVNQKPIANKQEFEKAIKEIPDNKIFSLLVFNEGMPIFLSMKMKK